MLSCLIFPQSLGLTGIESSNNQSVYQTCDMNNNYELNNNFNNTSEKSVQVENDSMVKDRFYIDSSGDTLKPTTAYVDYQGFNVPKNVYWVYDLPIAKIDITKLNYTKESFIKENGSKIKIIYDLGYNFWSSDTGWDNSSEKKTPSTSQKTSYIDISKENNSDQFFWEQGKDKKEECYLYGLENWTVDNNSGDVFLNLSYEVKLWYSWSSFFIHAKHASLLVLGPDGFSFENNDNKTNIKSKITTNFGELELVSGQNYKINIMNMFDYSKECYLESISKNWSFKAIVNFSSITIGEGYNGSGFTELVSNIIDLPEIILQLDETLSTGVLPSKAEIEISILGNSAELLYNNNLIASTVIYNWQFGTILTMTSISNLMIMYTN